MESEDKVLTCSNCGYSAVYKRPRAVVVCPKCRSLLWKDHTLVEELNIGLTKLDVHLKTSEDRVRLIPLGDVHIGAPHGQCDISKFQKFAAYIEDRDDTYTIGMGDFMDCAQKMPWRRGPSVYMQSESPQQQMDMMREILKPLAAKRKILGMHTGNHEDWVADDTGFQPAKTLADALNVPFLGPGCLINAAVNDCHYMIYSKHGTSMAKYKHTKLGALITETQDIFSHIYLMGHTHQLGVAKGGKYLEGRTIKTYYVLTGHFLNWEGSYAQEFGLSPCPSGCPQIKLFADRWDVHISV